MSSLLQRLRTSRQTWRRAHYASLATLAVLSALVGIYVQQMPVGQGIDRRAITFQLSQRPMPLHPNLRVITFKQSSDQRKKLAELIDTLRETGAKVVYFGVTFEMKGPPGPDIDLLQAAVRRAADGEMWLVLPRGQIQDERNLNEDSTPKLRLATTPFDLESWQARQKAGREPGNVLIGSPVGFDSDSPNGIYLHAVDVDRNEELLHCAGFAVAAFVSKPQPSPGLGEIRQVGDLGMVSLADVTWKVLGNQAYFVRPIAGGEASTADIDVALADASDYREKLVVIGGLFGRPVDSTILGRTFPPQFDAAMVNTLLHPEEGLSPSSKVNMILATLALSLFAAFGSLGRVPWRKRPVQPVVSIILSVGFALLALALAWWIPSIVLDQYRQILPVSPLLTSAALSSLIGWIAAAKFSKGFETADLPDRFDGQATVLFVDLKSSTPLVVKVGAEQAPKILGTFLRLCTDAIASNQGRVERTLGDGVLAVFFGPPVGGANHAERALTAMQQIAASTAPLFAEVVSRYSAETGFTAGIESGPLTMEYSREPGGWAWQSFGPTVHLAKRLQESSSSVGHAVVVGPGAQRLTSERGFNLILVGPIRAKGFEEDILASALQFPESSGKVTGSVSPK